MPNMEILKPSRRKLREGDVFAFSVPQAGVHFMFGRVIRVDMPMGDSPMPGANLIYLYGHRSKEKVPELGALTVDDLLVPPKFINRQPWLKGFFENVVHAALEDSDVLAWHCFYNPVKKAYVNDRGDVLAERIEPCGFFALDSYLTLDDAISEALGVAPASD